MTRIDTSNWSEARLQHRLALQCSLIEESFRAYSRHVHIADGYVGADWIRYDMLTRAAGLPLTALETALTQRLNCTSRIRQQGDRLVVLVRRPRPPVDLLDLLQSYRQLTSDRASILGLAENGRLVQLDFNQEGHVLVAGNSASGKTSLLRTLATSLVAASTPEQVRLMVIQGAAADGLAPLNYLPAAYLARPVITSAGEAARSLDELAAKVTSVPADAAGPRLIILIDGVEELLAAGQLAVLTPLTRLLAAKGPVSLVLSTARPESDLFNYVGANISTRLVGQVANQLQARTATGVADSRAEQLPDHGAFLLVREKRLTYFQAAHADQYDLSFLMLRLRQNGSSPSHKSRPWQLPSSQPAPFITPYF
ncbi:MAG TPA: FtsK/SpoIIIE domain-containing protein [Anaerolineae bacterium]